MNIIKELSRFSELTAPEVDDICTVLKTMKEKHPSELRKRDLKDITKDKSSKKTFSKSGHFAKWLIKTFMSDPNENTIIENKLSKKSRLQK